MVHTDEADAHGPLAAPGRGLKGLTQRQIHRRESILSAARELITQHGFEGVTMRELARASGVTLKTLYALFENKQRLLLTAVEERFRQQYQLIDETTIDHGIDRLFYIIDAVAETTRKSADYAKALAPVLSHDSVSAITAIRKATYHRAVHQIATEGDFLDWVEIDVISTVIYSQVTVVGQPRLHAREMSRRLALEVTKLEVALILRSVTSGYTHTRATDAIREIQAKVQAALRR